MLRTAGGDEADGHLEDGDVERAADADGGRAAEGAELARAEVSGGSDDEPGGQRASRHERPEKIARLLDGTGDAAGTLVAAGGEGLDADAACAFEGRLCGGDDA